MIEVLQAVVVDFDPTAPTSLFYDPDFGSERPFQGFLRSLEVGIHGPLRRALLLGGGKFALYHLLGLTDGDAPGGHAPSRW